MTLDPHWPPRRPIKLLQFRGAKLKLGEAGRVSNRTRGTRKTHFNHSKTRRSARQIEAADVLNKVHFSEF